MTREREAQCRGGETLFFPGADATLVVDLWAVLQKQLFHIGSLDYRLVARWRSLLAHIAFGLDRWLCAAAVSDMMRYA
ncbi:hypothetical protein [Pseudomonas cerasi]